MSLEGREGREGKEGGREREGWGGRGRREGGVTGIHTLI